MKSGRLDFETARRISYEDFLDWTKKAKPQPHDVVLSRRTNPGVTAVDRTGTEFALGQNLVLLRADGSRVDPAFLKWLVRSPAWWREIGKYLNVGAVFDSLRCGDVPNFELPIPPLRLQHRIGALLDALDDKIELNRRMNETLETMARALFKSWFVDFEPVRAKMQGRDTGLPQSIADLFPTEMARMDAQDAPVGWSAYSLSDIAVHHRSTVSPSTTPDVPFEHYSIPAHDAGQTPTMELGVALRSNKTLVPHDAVLLSKLNPHIPRVWAPSNPQGALQICSTEFLAFAPLAPGSRSLLFSLFSDGNFRTMLRSLATGTSKSHQRVPPESLKTQFAIAGEPNAFRAFDRLVKPWLNRVIANRAESQSLAQVRDLLLPKLISGEIRAAQAERVVEVVTGGTNG